MLESFRKLNFVFHFFSIPYCWHSLRRCAHLQPIQLRVHRSLRRLPPAKVIYQQPPRLCLIQSVVIQCNVCLPHADARKSICTSTIYTTHTRAFTHRIAAGKFITTIKIFSRLFARLLFNTFCCPAGRRVYRLRRWRNRCMCRLVV